MQIPWQEFDTAATALAGEGWCVLPNLLDAVQTRALATECRSLDEGGSLLPARTGAGRAASNVRGDRTHWFVSGAMSSLQQAFTDRIDDVRVSLSRRLMLGLVDCESHYAMYRPGAGYGRHLDCLRGTDTRVVSAVFYLNEAWRETDGGALRLYLADGTSRDIYPHAGSLLLFLSADFEHEVLPASRDRLSIACWMRQRTISPG